MATVAVDARFLTRALRGMPMYLFQVCREVPRLLPGVRFVLFLNTRFEHNVRPSEYKPRLEALAGESNLEFRDLPCDADPWWEQWLLPRAVQRCGADLLFLPGNRRPAFCPCPTVVTVHDVMERVYLDKMVPIPAEASWKLKAYYLRQRLYLKAMYARVLPKSDTIMTVSEFSAQEIAARLSVPRERIRVAYHGIPEAFRLKAGAPSPARRERRYTLMLGGDSYQKNPEGAVACWAKVPPDLRSRFPLRVVGFAGDAESPLLTALDSHGLRGEVEVMGWLEEEGLVEQFRGAAAFLFLSRIEGFGFPLLQAMASGTPVVHSDNTSLGELGGGAGMAVNPENPEEAALALTRLLEDEDLWEEKRRRGLSHSEGFTWRASARMHAEVFASHLPKETPHVEALRPRP